MYHKDMSIIRSKAKWSNQLPTIQPREFTVALIPTITPEPYLKCRSFNCCWCNYAGITPVLFHCSTTGVDNTVHSHGAYRLLHLTCCGVITGRYILTFCAK